MVNAVRVETFLVTKIIEISVGLDVVIIVSELLNFWTGKLLWVKIVDCRVFDLDVDKFVKQSLKICSTSKQSNIQTT